MITKTFVVAACSGALLALAAVGGARAAGPDAALLQRFEPVVQFDPLEQFLPTDVESFVTDADLEQLTAPGTWTVAAPHPAPGDLPGAGSGTWRLNQDGCTPSAAIGGLDCYSVANAQGGGGPGVYGHVVREDGDIVLEYWYFYYDDVYSYLYPPSDFVWQAHEGDWENVDVVLSGDAQPLFAAYSQHCVGGRRDWAFVPRFEDTHPIVHVAVGSHANYFGPGTHAIDVSCIPRQALAILALNGLPPPVDYANEGPAGGPPGAGVRILIHQLDDGVPTWTGFPGTWGELQYFHAPSPVGTVPLGTSPVGPAFHSEWADPLGTFATWKPQ